MADVSVLEVRLYGEVIGTLTRVPGDRTLFAFEESYIDNTIRPTLGLGFKDEFGELLTDFRPTQKKLLPFFSNLLPEGRMRDYLAERAGVNSEREFFLLWVLGQDLPGAITVTPADGEAWPNGLDDDDDDENGGDETDSHANALRFSLAGVQLKFSAIEKARGGLTIPAKGVGGDWIVKLPSREFEGVPENEFSMMTLARLIGMDVPTVDLIDLEAIDNLPSGVETMTGKAFIIKRFDRLSDGSSVHIEDFAQIFGVYPDDKYKMATMRRIAEVIGAEGDHDDIREFVRRLTFNVLIGNSDTHLKNWSLIYPDRIRPALAPAYDFVSTIPYIPDETFALKFSRTKRYDEFTMDELRHLAAKARLPEKLVTDTAQETITLFNEEWDKQKAHLPLSTGAVKAIENHLKRLSIAG